MTTTDWNVTIIYSYEFFGDNVEQEVEWFDECPDLDNVVDLWDTVIERNEHCNFEVVMVEWFIERHQITRLSAGNVASLWLGG